MQYSTVLYIAFIFSKKQSSYLHTLQFEKKVDSVDRVVSFSEVNKDHE